MRRSLAQKLHACKGAEGLSDNLPGSPAPVLGISLTGPLGPSWLNVGLPKECWRLLCDRRMGGRRSNRGSRPSGCLIRLSPPCCCRLSHQDHPSLCAQASFHGVDFSGPVDNSGADPARRGNSNRTGRHTPGRGYSGARLFGSLVIDIRDAPSNTAAGGGLAGQSGGYPRPVPQEQKGRTLRIVPRHTSQAAGSEGKSPGVPPPSTSTGQETG